MTAVSGWSRSCRMTSKPSPSGNPRSTSTTSAGAVRTASTAVATRCTSKPAWVRTVTSPRATRSSSSTTVIRITVHSTDSPGHSPVSDFLEISLTQRPRIPPKNGPRHDDPTPDEEVSRMRTNRRPAAAVRLLAGLATVSLAAAGCAEDGGDTAGGSGGGDAAGYPDQNITFVVPFSAGGPTDTVTRLIAEPMSEELGVQIVVQNVEGAGGTVGAGEVANAESDGYTVLMHHIGMSTAPALYQDLGFDPLEDFEMIG